MIGVALLVIGCGASGPGSIGVVMGRDGDSRSLVIREVPEGLSGDRAGLRPGDEIIMIDGLFVRDLEAKDIRSRLRGDVGTKVSITVVRGEEVRHVQVTRGQIGKKAPPKPPKEERIAE